MPNEDAMAEIAVPIVFLSLRARLVQIRSAVDHVAISDETLDELDRLLAETEDATKSLLGGASLPDGDYIDEVFDDEFLELCKETRVNLLAWINQPKILLRLKDPDAILLRFASIMEADLGTDPAGGQKPISTTGSFADMVSEMETAINKTFERLLKNQMI